MNAAPTFDRFVVLLNPASTHAKQMLLRIEELRKAYPDTPLKVVHTSAEGRAANRKVLVDSAKLLGPHTLLCIAGGDGTIGATIETLITAPGLDDAARKTPVLPLWGGNANDLAHMLNGTSYRKRLQSIMKKGRLVAIHPLECRLTTNDSVQTRLAVCYASFGASAFATIKMDEVSHRRTHPLHHVPGGRFLLELATTFSAMLDAPTFRAEEQGRPKIIYERIFSNGSRFAKVDRLPVKLTDNMFYLHTLEDKRLVSILPRIADVVQKRMAEKFLHDRSSFKVTEATKAQFDGEAIDIPAGTRVRMRLSPQPFWALSTLLAEDTSEPKNTR